MTWGSPTEFFAMGGYAFYVWGSFGACGVALLLEPFLVGRRQTRIIHSLRHEASAQQLDKEAN